MMNNTRRPETSPRYVDARPRSTPERSVTVSLIDDLERLRELVLERLSSIETLARERSESVMPAPELSALEESFKKKSAEFEEARRQLQAQAEQEKHEWIASLTQLEDDRRLLAEAWERVDQERIDAVSAPQEHSSVHSPRPHSPAPVSTAVPSTGATIPIRSAGADSDAYNPVAQAILQQFQTLCSDVRQSAHARRASR
jgi:hypothetical protein